MITPVAKVKPAVLSYSSDFGTPVSIFHKLSETEKNAFLFESTEGDGRLARFSFIGIDPVLTVRIDEGRAILTRKEEKSTQTVDVQNPVLLLKQVLDQYIEALKERLKDDFDLLVSKSLPGMSDLPFVGGLVGYMGYGAVSYLEKIPRQASNPLAVPEGHYGLYDTVIVFDHQYRRLTIVSHRGEAHAHSVLEAALKPSPLPPLALTNRRLSEEEIFANVKGPFTKESFEGAVRQAKEYIYEGQVFQIVLSQRFSMPASASAIDIYRMLQSTNPSPYAYFLKCDDFVYVGSSPETFVRCQDGKVSLRAIAGTRHRGATAQEDARLAEELRANEKEMAEHRMLVDLGRNDLGRICRPGTVKVGELACLTKYTHVMHLATEITGDLTSRHSCFDAFQSCFPAGTVSGAPKVRAMQLLAHLEPERRGVYSGAVGYFDMFGNMDGAIAIRSTLLKGGMAHVNAGAGIVFDSDPTMEYDETRNKAKSLIQAIKLAEGGGQ